MQKSSTFPCTEPGCTKALLTPQALGSHKNRVHGIISTNERTIAYKKTYPYRRRLKSRVVAPPPPLPKRKYTRHAATPPPAAVSFCPRCGANIGAIALALNLTK